MATQQTMNRYKKSSTNRSKITVPVDNKVSFENKNYFNEVQNDSLSKYAFHQHGYDLSAYTQMVASGIDKEEAIQNIIYFYQNAHRILGSENK